MSKIEDLVIQVKNTAEKIRQGYFHPEDFSFADGQATQRRLELYKKVFKGAAALAACGVFYGAIFNSLESSAPIIGIGAAAAATFGLLYLSDANHLQRG